MTPPASRVSTFVRNRTRIEALAAAITGDREEARDVASDTFVAFVERGPTHDEASLSWLFRSARNRAIDRLRARERARRAAVVLDVVPDLDPDRGVGRPQAAALVLAALDRLEARDRTALAARFLDDRPYEEVAGLLRTSVPQARVVVHRAARRLRRETITLLAERHGADVACKRRLVESGSAAHPGCSPCTAVSDELASLTHALAPIPALPLVERVAVHAANLAASPRLPRHGLGGRLAEGVAALVLFGGGVGAPAVSTAVAPATEAARAPAVAQASAAPTVPEARIGASAGLEGRARASGLADRVVRRDREGDDPVRSALEYLRLPVRVPDVLDESLAGGLDIRVFEVATRYEDGAPVALRFRYDLAGRALTTAGYTIRWEFGGSGCTAYAAFVAAAGAGRQDDSLDVQCPATVGGALDGEPSPTWAGVEGDEVTVEVRFEALRGAAVELLRPGATLRAVKAYTSGNPYSWDFATGDAAPDGSELSYRIPR